MAEVVDANDVHGRLASITPYEDFLTLVVSQFRLAAHNNPSGFGAFPAFAGGLRIKPRSNSASPPSTVSISLP